MDNIKTPKIHPYVKHVFHLYVIRSGKRDELQNYLKENKISTGIHYPTALPFLKAYDTPKEAEEIKQERLERFRELVVGLKPLVQELETLFTIQDDQSRSKEKK